jgi:fucose permease
VLFRVWLIYCVIAMQEPLIRALTPYVTSAFRLHSLTATTGIISSIVSGLIQIPLAKVLDTWGRPEGLTIMLVFWILGFVMMAACNNVETYCAAQVFSAIG